LPARGERVRREHRRRDHVHTRADEGGGKDYTREAEGGGLAEYGEDTVFGWKSLSVGEGRSCS